ncbi:MAG: hypothetical protein Q4C45_05910 [Oscillospiraceae bacterium]|nr:hypothetical protein [Oscillospiraceae bacterium]
MGLLVGLPLGIFRLLFGLLMLALRLAVPIAVIALLVTLYRRSRNGGAGQPRREKPGEPEFDGPVYTVDYEEVDEDGK